MEVYKRIFEAIPGGMLLVNRHGRIVAASAQAMFGYSSGALTGEPVEILLPGLFQGAGVAGPAGEAR